MRIKTGNIKLPKAYNISKLQYSGPELIVLKPPVIRKALRELRLIRNAELNLPCIVSHASVLLLMAP